MQDEMVRSMVRGAAAAAVGSRGAGVVEAAAEVEEVVRARRGIWGGVSGRKFGLFFLLRNALRFWDGVCCAGVRGGFGGFKSKVKFPVQVHRLYALALHCTQKKFSRSFAPANMLSKQKVDKRQRNEEEQASKRQKLDDGAKNALPVYATKFDEEELKNEERKPKKKVAVMIGYAGTGYRGMQLTHDQKTIEGDLFQAFVKAGAISKANADDPKKSSFVRCARTDKGVHAAGNVISLKLIVEDEDIVERINKELVPQIRVWGFERTNNSFSAYQLVDSRIYEYLIPTHSLLPPHPSSFLGRKCVEWAEKKGELEKWKGRQEEVEGYWEKVDEKVIRPILEEYDEDTRKVLEKAVFLKGDDEVDTEDGADQPQPQPETTADATKANDEATTDQSDDGKTSKEAQDRITEGIKRIRAAYIAAKRSYRIPPARLTRLRETLAMYVGTRNYHNYTIQKPATDPSAKRVIKSFVVNPTPILINGTEWLSLKVHGQSFMMHQIRKMVGMAALVVRCGTDPGIIFDSYGADNISIPKAPSLGLLLERPVFDTYNRRAKTEFGKERLDFDKYAEQMERFKQTEIYERMYRDEDKDNVFGNFWNHVDNFPSEVFLFVTSGGVEATRTRIEKGDGGAKRNAGNANQKRVLLVDADGAGSDDEDVTANDANGDEG